MGMDKKKILSVLKKVEWSSDAGNGHACCPVCGGIKVSGHFDKCELKQLKTDSVESRALRARHKEGQR